MTTNRVAVVEQNLDSFLAEAQPAASRLAGDARLSDASRLTACQAIRIFECQLESRALDVAARELKRTGRSFYTISSAGHEDNAALGELLRLDDPCILHYRSGALMMARARKLAGSTPVFDTLLSLCASKEDPISQGRHKVWGSRPLWVPPQTSTIASHLPKASGLAVAIGLARRLGVANDLAADSIVCCSFGDASFNHATALSGINAARYAHRRGTPVPILFVCEDNGIGISVETPKNWIHDNASNLAHLAYFEAEGELEAIHETTAEAIDICRRTRAPVFLHLHCVRLWGHAGSDVETTYHSLEEIEAVEKRDPLLVNAKRLIETGAATPAELAALVRDTRTRVMAAAEEAAQRPKLTTRAEVVAPLAPYDAERVRIAASRPRDVEKRKRAFGDVLPEHATSATRKTMAAHLNSALADELADRSEMVIFGEDVGKKGGVYGVTGGLQKRFGAARVFDTLLDETSILGMAQGMAHIGLLPVPEIQYLAYIHNALDQLRGEACSLSYFSSGQFTNPMVVRIQGLAYQKGFGGHFHNDNSIGALRDIPGLVVVTPSRGDDAAKLLRGALSLAEECGRVVCFLEPIALYHERDLYGEGDNLWLFEYPKPEEAILPGEVGVYAEEHRDVLIVSYANGLRLSLRAAKLLREEHDIKARILDLRWLNPLPMEAIATHLADCPNLLVVDECRSTGGGIADAIVAALSEAGFNGSASSVRAADSYVPLGAATSTVLVGEADIVAAARRFFA